ncbi:MAG: DUF6128 domain-containing protein [Lachnospiraceae bacterium]|nr:DUF6128 domain-containing protein [Lachnospiraceae bacterium]
MNYEKKMVYLSYNENGKRISNGGYVKLEIRGHKLLLDMQINLKKHAYEGKCSVTISGNGQSISLGKIYLDKGSGSYKRVFEDSVFKKDKLKLSYEDLSEIIIKIDENSNLNGIIKEKQKPVLPSSKDDQFKKVIEGKEWQYGTVLPEEPADNSESSENKETVIDTETEIASDEKNEAVHTEVTSKDIKASEADTNIAEEELFVSDNDIAAPTFAAAYQDDMRQILHDLRKTPDKWQQLLKNYKQINPYNDERLYISLEPKDFVIIGSEYQHLSQNSFLLHGFYNYKHIILGKENNEIYLGVPGVYYEREKMVAMMFGFEAFECEGGNAENGKFGYYLKKVKI